MSRMAVLAIGFLFASSAVADTMTVKYGSTAEHAGGSTSCLFTGWQGCLVFGADGGQITVTNLCGYFTFNDPLPHGSKLKSVAVRASIHPAAIGFHTPGIVYAILNGDRYNNPDRIIGTAPEPSSPPVCGGFSFIAVNIVGAPYPNGIPYYNYGQQNYILMSLSREDGIDVEFVEVTFEYDPPPTVELELTDSTPDNERKVLIHKYRPGDNYPSSAQRRIPGNDADRDRNIEIKATVKDAHGIGVPGQTVYFRFRDPPDPSPYIPSSSRVDGDNFEGPGTLSATSATSDGNGDARVILTVAARAAGDNYQVEASTLGGFGGSIACGPQNNCKRSGVITAWKRVYLETDYMFRVGAFVTQTSGPAASPGALPNIVYVDTCKGFHQGQPIYLIHGPRGDGAGGGFHGEPSVIGDKPKHLPGGNCSLILNTSLMYNYYGPDSGYDFLADAVGVLDPPDPFYRPNASLVAGEFAKAFVEYNILPVQITFNPVTTSDPLSIVPHWDQVGRGDRTNTQEIEHRFFADKWCFEPGDNRQHLIGATVDGVDNTRRGITFADDDDNYTYIYVDAMETHFSPHLNLNAEITVHELAHQWHVNPGIPPFGGGYNQSEHCQARNWENTGSCTGFAYVDQNVLANGTVGSCMGICSEFEDGRVEFHVINVDFDSEYTFIRRRWEPVPQRKGVVN